MIVPAAIESGITGSRSISIRTAATTTSAIRMYPQTPATP